MDLGALQCYTCDCRCKSVQGKAEDSSSGGALVNIVDVTPGRLAGTYLVRVLPIRTETWKGGVYIFAVAVERSAGKGSKADKGQNLASVLMD